MTSLVVQMNKDVKETKPFLGKSEIVKATRQRLIHSTKKSADEFIETQRHSTEIAKKKKLG